jgi:DNA-binding NtrC family response regulator
VPRVRQSELATLTAQDWPGNVRELQNLVERAVIVWQGGRFQFPLDVPARPIALAPTAGTTTASPMLTRDELKHLERESIARALEQTNGMVSGPGGAAELLELRPTTLASRIAALGLKRAKPS